MNVRLLGAAQLDAIDFADWYDNQVPGLGTRFLQAVDDLVARLTAHPRLYGPVPSAPRGRDVRQAPVTEFMVIAVYEVRPTEVLVVSLTHARSVRQPWRRRLPDPP